MYLRTPIHYEYVKDIHRRMVATIEEQGQVPKSFIVRGREFEVDPESWPAYRDASEDDLKKLWISQMNGATDYAEILMGMRWSMLLADEPLFITSDNPITIVHPSLRFKGLSNSETLFSFRYVREES